MSSKDFITGCNYWASNAGTEMWNNWDINVVDDDLKILSKNGIKYLRVFPNWHDFQPVHPVLTNGGDIIDYRFEDDKKTDNPYYLKREMIERFEIFCDLCEKYKIKLIVGLLTGWMSGRLFIPPVLYGKNLITDPTAIYFEQLFVKGFVHEFKDKKSIWAWDVGNECSCMSDVDEFEQAAVWTKLISDAVRCADPDRPLISGIHEMTASRYDDVWTIGVQAEESNMLVSHPYPFWSNWASYDKVTSVPVILYPTAISKFYSEIGHKPCLVEEIGTMGASVCSDEKSYYFFKAVLFSAWSNGFPGVLWWCAHEQTNLRTLPYTFNMCETELGILNKDKKPKKVMLAINDFNGFVNCVDFDLPKAHTDAVCISTYGQDQIGIAYATYVLSRQSGFNIEYQFCEEKIRECGTYILPSYQGINVMPQERYNELCEKIKSGATLYISYNGGIISGFEELTGLRVIETEKGSFSDKLSICGEEISYIQDSRLELTPITADILAYDSSQRPVITKNHYGKGIVYFVAFAPEGMTVKRNGMFDGNLKKIYETCFENIISKQPLKILNENLYATYHYMSNEMYCVISNYSSEPQRLDYETRQGYETIEFIDSNTDCEPYGIKIIKFVKKNSLK